MGGGRRGILTVARESESPATQVLDKADRVRRHRAAGAGQRLSRVRVGLGVLGVALLFLLGGMHDLGLSPNTRRFCVPGAASRNPHRGRRGLVDARRAPQSAAGCGAVRRSRGAGTWPSRIGLAIVGLIAAIAAQSWFDPGRLLAGGDLSPVVGTAWLGRLFAPWSWSGSDLGGPAANENNAAVRRGLLARPRASRVACPRRRASGTPRFSPAPRRPAICSCGPFASARQDPPSALSLMSSTPTLSSSEPIRCTSPPWCC